jgi:thiamine-phosphate pyrophosphorylase
MEAIPKDILRIIDANLNRAGEGLRTLEEFARMSLNDSVLTQQLKDMRHGIIPDIPGLRERLLDARDSGGDIGSNMKSAGQDEQQGFTGTITANARRVEESLRVLEETAKTPGVGLDTDRYRQARFQLYTIEKELLLKMSRQDKLKRLKGLYVIIDTASLRGRSHLEAAEKMIHGGAGVIQLRDKETGKAELIRIAGWLTDLCRKHGVLFIVNDYLDVALAVDADGLHVGEDDLPAAIARKLLPRDKLLGCSTRTVEGAKALIKDGADHLGVGGMYPTTTKADNEVVGIKRLKEIRQAVDVPLVAIGGINKDNISEVAEAGADAVAVISAVANAEDIESATRQLVNIIEGGSLE